MMPTRNDTNRNAPIFIVGYMHSGTTLLQQILGRHPAVFVGGGETRQFSNFQVTRQRYPNLAYEGTKRSYLIYTLRVIKRGYATVNFREGFGAQVSSLTALGLTAEEFDALLEQAQNVYDHHALFVLTYDFLTQKAGKSRWLDKLPGYVSQVPQIAAAVPPALFLELVRDPRDILASKKSRTKRGGGFDPLWDTLAWRAAVRAGNVAGNQIPGRVLRVRYEDLVRTPDSEVPRICDFLDLDFSPNMLTVGWINTTTGQDADGQQGISTSAIGKWSQQLSSAEITISQLAAREALPENDYQPMPIAALYYLSLPHTLLRSGLEFFSRLYSRWRQGGFGYLLNVLTNYQKRFKGQSGRA